MNLTASQQALVDEGGRLLAAGRPWHAHEAWEAVWRALDGPERGWLQGCILVAAALVKRDAGAAMPARKLASRALARLDGAPSVLFGLDVEALRGLARALV